MNYSIAYVHSKYNFGDKVSLLLSEPKRLRVFNILMGGLLILSALFIFVGEFL